METGWIRRREMTEIVRNWIMEAFQGQGRNQVQWKLPGVYETDPEPSNGRHKPKQASLFFF